MESRPRAALLVATSGHSGVDRIMANLLPAFGAVDYDFDLLSIAGHGPYLDQLPTNVRSVPLRARHRNTVVPALISYVRRERPITLLTASHRLNRAALLARAIARVPGHVTLRMGMSLRGMAEDLGPRKSRRLFRSMRFWYPRAEAMVAPSVGVATDLQTYAGVARERLHVIPNPIVDDTFNRLAAEPLNDHWLAERETPVILAAGALEPRKDFATLLRAFARVRRDRTVRLIILGEGRERARLSRLAYDLGVAEDVRLPGHVANPYPWMARAAVFALTSRREGSGAVLVEALACGTPVVATDCPSGPAETLQNGAIGPLVDVGDDGKLAEALCAVLDAPLASEQLIAATHPFRTRSAVGRYLMSMGLDPGALAPAAA